MERATQNSGIKAMVFAAAMVPTVAFLCVLQLGSCPELAAIVSQDAATPRAVWLWPRSGGHVVVYGSDQPSCVPCPGEATLTLFDPQGRRVSTTPIDVGYRTFASRAELISVETVGPVARIGVKAQALTVMQQIIASLADPHAYLYYARSGDRFIHVRTEYELGQLAREHFGSNPEAGAHLPTLAPDYWEAALFSDDPSEVLEALRVYTGTYADLSTWPTDVAHVPTPLMELVESLQGRPRVRARIEELKASPVDWIAEAAELDAPRFVGPMEL